jgi:transcriptional regulator with XRE-family HTH domain
MAPTPTTGIGSTLREWRVLSGYTINEAAQACSIPLTQMLNIETNTTGPSCDVLRCLEHLYRSSESVDGGTTLDEINRRRLPGTEIDWIGLALQSDMKSNQEILDEVGSTIRRLRRLGSTDTVYMRETEADLLVSMLDLSEEDCRCEVMAAFKLGLVDAGRLLAGAATRTVRRSRSVEKSIGGHILAQETLATT